MNNTQHEIAIKLARSNYKKIESTMPENLKQREQSLFQLIMESKGNSITKLKRLYSEMDSIYSHVYKLAACKKGCDSCCHQEVALSELEIEYILENSTAKKNKTASNLNKPDDPCPFLKSHKCSIYGFRPFVCRRHLSIADSSRWCDQDICNDYKFPLINFSEVDKTYSYIINNSSKSHYQKDIRLVFKKKF